MEPLRVTLIQTPLHWENREANLALFTELIGSINEPTDLIVLPEMFLTGFSMKTELGEYASSPVFEDLRRGAAERGAAICGSLMVTDKGKAYNRLYFVKPDGEVHTYDKRHLFRMAAEHQHFQGGKQKLIVEWKGWKICPLICYDLRFPVWSRNHWNNGEADYDLLIYVANWPERRNHPWKALLVARAIENLSYVVGVNRVGVDGNDVSYSGDSVAIDFKGEALTHIPPGETSVTTVSLSYEDLQDYRKIFPAWQDADAFSIS